MIRHIAVWGGLFSGEDFKGKPVIAHSNRVRKQPDNRMFALPLEAFSDVDLTLKT